MKTPMRRAALALTVLGCCAAATSGCGASDTAQPGSAAVEDVATAAEPAEPQELDLSVKAPDTVRSKRVTLRGTVTPGSAVYVNDDEVPVDGDGAWSTTVAAEPGKNRYLVTASQDSYEWTDYNVTVTRKRSKADIARAVAVRKAREERRRQATANRQAQAAEKLETEINDILAGSGRKMSKPAARSIYDRCMAGAIDDFDICFEAGYVIGKNATESAINKYE